MDSIGVSELGGAVRLGLAHYSTGAEVEHMLEVISSLR